MSHLSEYESLRAEIIDVSGRQLTTLTVAFTVAGALIGFGFQAREPFVVLSSIIVLTFAGIQLVNHEYSIMRIACYIRRYIESKDPELNWETYMRHFRKKASSRKTPLGLRLSWPSYQFLVIFVGVISIFVALVLALSPANSVDLTSESNEAVLNSINKYAFQVIAIVSLLWILFSWWLARMMRRAANGELGDILDKEFQLPESQATNAG